MKVLIVHNLYRDRGGEERYIELHRRLLEERGHEVSLFTKDSRDVASKWDKLTLPLSMTHSSASAREMRDLLKRERPDVVHVNNLFPLISPSVLAVVKDAGIPLVMTLHNYRLLCPIGTFLNPQGQMCEKCADGNSLHCFTNNCRGGQAESLAYAVSSQFHKMTDVFAKYVDAFICPSRFSQQKLAQYGFDVSKTTVIPHYVDAPEATVMEQATEARLNNEAAPEPTADQHFEEPYITYVGRLYPEKGILTLIRAMERLPHIRMKVLGTGPLRPQVEAEIRQRKLDHVELMGHVTGDVFHRLVTGARFSVLPSECYEGMPYSALENLSFGKPMVATNIGGLPEVIEDGVTGLLFPFGDEVLLAARIEELWTDDAMRRRFAENCLQRHAERFSPDRYYQSVMGLYQTVIERGNRL
ncbi:MAG: glycosyltransferase family 4 protein [Tumebacillaceae bacterium]